MNDQNNEYDNPAYFHYSESFVNHLSEPRNAGIIKNPDGIGEAKSQTAICGDIVRMMISVKINSIESNYDNTHDSDVPIITDIKYKVYGCAVVIVSASIVSELAKGKHIDEIYTITIDSIVKEIGRIPSKKFGCVKIAIDALKNAVISYQQSTE